MLGQIQLKKDIAARLKKARIAAQFHSVTDFCRKNTIDEKKYVAIEEAQTPLRASQAIFFCNLFNISIYWLFCGEEYVELAD